MAHNNKIRDNIQISRKTKIETTYEYVPIIGEILGFWRKLYAGRFDETIEIHLRTSIREYDRLYINGQQVDIEILKTKQD